MAWSVFSWETSSAERYCKYTSSLETSATQVSGKFQFSIFRVNICLCSFIIWSPTKKCLSGTRTDVLGHTAVYQVSSSLYSSLH